MIKNRALDILLKKFPATEYALMAEVRDAAGFGASRSADFIAMGLWPSRGLDMIGIERKSYRTDWIKELKTPAKAENIFQYCDRWYLLTDNENVAKIDEIPINWGWMHINLDGKLKVIKEAPKLSPIPISRGFLACVLKRAACKDGWVTEQSIQSKIEEAKQAGLQERDHRNKRTMETYEALLTDVKAFEETTGIKLLNPRWGISGKKTGEAVKFILDGGIDEIEKQMQFIKNYHTSIGKKIEEFDSLRDADIKVSNEYGHIRSKQG